MRIRQFYLNKVLAALVAASVVLGNVTTWAGSIPFSRLLVFGDSLSDMGRFYELTGGFPPAPYWQGRVSNGKVWPEYLAEFLRMPLLPEDNYAVLGATTGRVNYRDGLFGKTYPGALDEIDLFLSEPPPADVQDALFIYWTRANDVFVTLENGGAPEDLIMNGVMNTLQAVQALYMAGARHIVVVNMPDLGLTPSAREYGLGPQLTGLSMA